jgi:hypothetical protein
MEPNRINTQPNLPRSSPLIVFLFAASPIGLRIRAGPLSRVKRGDGLVVLHDIDFYCFPRQSYDLDRAPESSP